MDNYLVLGAGGFIGKNLVKRLIESDYKKITLYDMPEALKTFENEENEDINLLPGFFTPEEDFDYVTENMDVVFHLISTSIPNNSNDDIAKELTDNAVVTAKLLDSCVKNGVEKVIFISSGGTIYGKAEHLPLREEDGNAPISGYGLQKLTIEKMLYLFHHLHGLDYRIVRLSNPYGPYQKPNGLQGVVTTFIYKALNGETLTVYGDGGVIRDYIFVDDAVNAILNIAKNNGTERVFNVGSGTGHSVKEIISMISKVLNIDVRVTYAPGRNIDVPANVLCIDKYKNDMGEIISVPLEEGIKKTAEFLSRYVRM